MESRDTVDFRLESSAVNVNLTGDQSVTGGDTSNITGFENVVGSAFNDTLIGNDKNNTLIGREGDDVLHLGNDGKIDTVLYAAGDGVDTVLNFVRGEGGDRLEFRNIAEIDMVAFGAITEFRESNGVFGTGNLLMIVDGVNTFDATDENTNLRGATFNFLVP